MTYTQSFMILVGISGSAIILAGSSVVILLGVFSGLTQSVVSLSDTASPVTYTHSVMTWGGVSMVTRLSLCTLRVILIGVESRLVESVVSPSVSSSEVIYTHSLLFLGISQGVCVELALVVVVGPPTMMESLGALSASVAISIVGAVCSSVRGSPPFSRFEKKKKKKRGCVVVSIHALTSPISLK